MEESVGRHALGQVYRWSITHAYAIWIGYQGAGLLGDPSYLISMLGILAMLSSALILAGLQWPRSSVLSLQIEKVGHILAASMWFFEIWLSYRVIGGFEPGMVLSLLLLTASGIKAHRLNAVARRETRRIRSEIDEGDA